MEIEVSGKVDIVVCKNCSTFLLMMSQWSSLSVSTLSLSSSLPSSSSLLLSPVSTSLSTLRSLPTVLTSLLPTIIIVYESLIAGH